MNSSDKDKLYVILFLLITFILDIAVIGGVLLHGKANFPELFKHLKS